VEWGAEYLHHNPASPTTLVLDSDSLVTSGFSGTQTTLAGAYDPGAAGNSIISTLVYTSVQAVCGTGVQSHIGTFRVKARINTGPGGCIGLSTRFAWRVGDGSYTTNTPVTGLTDLTQEYLELDLGLITIPEASTGTQAWDGRVEMWTTNPGDQIYVDYLMLIPVDAGYGKVRASYAYSAGVVSARDEFTGTTAAAGLNGTTAPAGGTWASSGDADDFLFVNTDGSGGRFAILGTGTFTNVEVGVDMYFDYTNATGVPPHGGTIARWTDSSNYLYVAAEGAADAFGITGSPVVAKVVAGVTTTLASFEFLPETTWRQVRLVVFASGRGIASMLTTDGVTVAEVDFYDAALATGGTLATGKAGFWDGLTSATRTATRYYDNFYVAVPAAEPVAVYSGRSLKIRHDDTIRESSAGGTWGRPPTYRGSRFYVQPAGDADRTTRVAVKLSRNDLDSAADDNLTDQLTLTATVTPRYSVVPRT
jgi:hypothetical protein